MLTIVFYRIEGPPFTGHSYLTTPMGGSEIAIIHLARSLVKLGHKVYVFNKTDTERVYDGVIYKNFHEINELKDLVDIFIIFNEENCNLIPAKSVLLWNTIFLDFQDNNILNLLNDNKIKKIIHVSNWQNEYHLYYLPYISREYFHVINNPVWLNENIETQERQQFRLISTFHPNKGLKHLFRLFPKIKKQIPEVELFVFGSETLYGENKDTRLKIIKDLGIDPTGIHLKQSISQYDLSIEYCKSYLFLHPGLRGLEETSSICTLEAQGYGTVPIVTDAGALAETVGDSGIIVEGDIRFPEVEKKYIDKVIELIFDKEKWEYLSKKGIEKIRNYYSPDIISKKWEKLFLKLL